MNQHYVPKAYLKNFAKKQGRSYMIDVYDKKNNRFFKSNIKGICAEKDIYTLNSNSEIAKDKLAIENLYSRFIEPAYNDSYKILINPNVSEITQFQHCKILIGIIQ